MYTKCTFAMQLDSRQYWQMWTTAEFVLEILGSKAIQGALLLTEAVRTQTQLTRAQAVFRHTPMRNCRVNRTRPGMFNYVTQYNFSALRNLVDND
jgi:hypothetical protein